MTTAAIREKLHNYISEADDIKIKNLYEIFEDQMTPSVDWADDKEFVAELDERFKRWENGTDPGVSIEQAKTSLDILRKERYKRSSK
jgi:hypothetical protein